MKNTAIISVFLILNTIFSFKLHTKHKTKLLSKSKQIKIEFEYPYSCNTWFNRGKDTCHAVISRLEKEGFSVVSSIRGFHLGNEHNKSNNDFFQITYTDDSNKKFLLATSDESSPLFHYGLKYFAYNFFSTDLKTGERTYQDTPPHREELIEFIANELKSSTISR